jgi:hypothetical protein
MRKRSGKSASASAHSVSESPRLRFLETTEFDKGRRPQRLGETVSCLFLGENIFETNLSCIQNCSLVVELHIEVHCSFVKLRVVRERNGRLIVRHNIGHWRSVQARFGQKRAEPLKMMNSVVLSGVLGMSRRCGHFPLSLGRPGYWWSCKLEHIAGRGVCTVSDDGATEVGIGVSDHLSVVVFDAIRLCGFDIAQRRCSAAW